MSECIYEYYEWNDMLKLNYPGHIIYDNEDIDYIYDMV